MTKPRVPEQPHESRRALADAYATAMKAEADRRAAARRGVPRDVPWLGILALIALAGVGGWVWVARPTWLFRPPVEVSAPVEDAGLRLTMYAAATRLREHVARTGAAPASLAELEGVSGEGLTYQRDKSGSWMLSGRRGTAALTLRANDDLDAFLGTSLSNLLQRGGR